MAWPARPISQVAITVRTGRNPGRPSCPQIQRERERYREIQRERVRRGKGERKRLILCLMVRRGGSPMFWWTKPPKQQSLTSCYRSHCWSSLVRTLMMREVNTGYAVAMFLVHFNVDSPACDVCLCLPHPFRSICL